MYVYIYIYIYIYVYIYTYILQTSDQNGGEKVCVVKLVVKLVVKRPVVLIYILQTSDQNGPGLRAGAPRIRAFSACKRRRFDGRLLLQTHPEKGPYTIFFLGFTKIYY